MTGFGPEWGVLFVGINPGVRSALTGHHFAGFSNRFWKLLFQSGLVPERVTYLDDDRLPEWGYGITNIVARATRGIDELRPENTRPAGCACARKFADISPRSSLSSASLCIARCFPERRARWTMGLQQGPLAKQRSSCSPTPVGGTPHFSIRSQMLAAFNNTPTRRLRDRSQAG